MQVNNDLIMSTHMKHGRVLKSKTKMKGPKLVENDKILGT
jgi:hypothetical protein